jgi:hypothetical protein
MGVPLFALMSMPSCGLPFRLPKPELSLPSTGQEKLIWLSRLASLRAWLRSSLRAFPLGMTTALVLTDGLVAERPGDGMRSRVPTETARTSRIRLARAMESDVTPKRMPMR